MKYNLTKPMLVPVFDFQKGDVVEFCDEHYFVMRMWRLIKNKS